MTVVTRIAPSPTGDPHVGTGYVALFNWAWARRNGGRFILRIEDTDRERSRGSHEQEIIDALEWLGVAADESPVVGGEHGPYRQSERGDVYARYTDELIARGHAYRCFCTPERMAALREEQKERQAEQSRLAKAAKQAGDESFVPERTAMGYDGHCRDVPADASAERAKTETHVVRLKVDKAGTTRFDDLLRGEIVIANENVDDQVLLKSDGMPTYHLANVVDDHLMGVTIIMRAEEWIPSVPKHVMLYEAFGWDPPVFAHVPLLRNADKSKISKRKNPTSILWYREHGYLPEALVNFLALQGWRPKDDENEEFDVEQFVERFDPKDISTGGPVFDLVKLDWLNGEKIRKRPLAQLVDLIVDEGHAGDWTREEVERVLPLFHERLVTLSEFPQRAAYLKARPEPDMEGLAKKTKKVEPAALARALEAAAASLIELDGKDDETREAALRAIAEAEDMKVGALFMGLRVAVTGAIASPPLLPSVDVVGAEESAARVRAVVEKLGAGV